MPPPIYCAVRCDLTWPGQAKKLANNTDVWENILHYQNESAIVTESDRLILSFTFGYVKQIRGANDFSAGVILLIHRDCTICPS